MNKKFAAVAVSLISASFAAPSFAAVEVAKVNDHVITVDQLNTRFQEQLRMSGVTTTTKKAVLDDMIKREVAVQEAKKLKLEQNPDIQERINSVLFYAYIEKKLGSEFERLGVAESEAKNWYDKNPEIRTSHIFLTLAPGSPAEEEKRLTEKLNEVAKEIKTGKMSFAEAAQKYSEDPSGPMGGDLDYRTRDRLDPGFYQAAVKLGKPGDTSGVVRTPYGLHLIRLTGKKGWGETDRTRIKRIILEEKRDALVAKHLNDLRQKSKVTVNNGAL